MGKGKHCILETISPLQPSPSQQVIAMATPIISALVAAVAVAAGGIPNHPRAIVLNCFRK